MTTSDYEIQGKTRQLRELATTSRVELSSPDHSVRVVVGPNGTIHNIEVTARALKYSGPEVGELVVELLREADRQMKAELGEKLAELLGDHMIANGATPFTGVTEQLERLRRAE